MVLVSRARALARGSLSLARARSGSLALPPSLSLSLSLTPARSARTRARSEGGFFKAIMKFPQDYPNMPPTLKITSDFWHPNVYPDGKVCIS